MLRKSDLTSPTTDNCNENNILVLEVCPSCLSICSFNWPLDCGSLRDS